MRTSKPSVSIVIPAYNEELHIISCLEAIKVQTVSPLEVIVVDNNSSDKTIATAASYPFVTILREHNQGVVYARNTGYDHASGDIIARIDADTIVPSNWIATLQDLFANTEVDALSGAIHYYDMPLPRTCNAIDLFFRKRLARLLGNHVFLQGANMAICRTAWAAVKAYTCDAEGLHEDFDLAIHLEQQGMEVVFEERLTASISSRRVDTSFKHFWHYVRMNPHTYARHHISARRYMYPVVTLVILHYPLLRLMHKSYNPLTGSFSVRQIFSAPALQRVDPTLNRL
jgi:glycosyltransferase involved in cell wall biosynthesis